MLKSFSQNSLNSYTIADENIHTEGKTLVYNKFVK